MGEPIYRGYDAEALYAQYNNRARVADALTYMERWASQSATVRKDLPCQLDLSYGDHPRHQLDIFNGPGCAAPTRRSWSIVGSPLRPI